MIAVVWFIPVVVVGQIGEPLIVAHRGASKAAPENTIPAFELAWEQGADAIEGDFYLTQDRQIVCIHDRSTKRYCRQNLVVAESTLAELQKLDVGSWHSEKFAGTRIPTIDAVLKTVPAGKKIFVEVKCGPEIVPILKKSLRQSSLSDKQIVIISFNKEVIRAIKKTAPQWTANWLVGMKGTDKKGRFEPTVETVLKTLKEISADGFSSSKDHIDAQYIQQIHQAGFPYHVWTVDRPADAKKFYRWGAQSITTNLPGKIRTALGE